jgi:long-subunit acyl-CoA synthetase (AMP-forming)
MGPSALSALIEGLAGDGQSAVFSRAGGAWRRPETRFGDQVRGLAAALSGYGLSVGARAAVLGTEGYGTLCGGLAVLAAGATLVPLDPGIPDDPLRRVLASTGAVHAIASDERQLARILALRPELPALELVLLISASLSERKPPALLVPAAIEIGSAALAADPALLRRVLAESEGGTACVLIDARGQTRPITRTALLGLAASLGKSMDLKPRTTVLSALPVGGVTRLGAALAALSRGATLLLADPEERPDSGLDQRPADAILLDVAGLERLHRAWIEDIDATPWLRRAATRWALRHAREPERRGWKYRVAENVALHRLRDKLGGRTSTLDVVTTTRGGASSEVESFCAAVGLTIRYFSPDAGAALAR